MGTKPRKEGGRYNPLNDFLFLKTMGEKGDEEQLLGFLNAVLGKSGEDRYSSVTILENRNLTADVVGDKSSILDVRAVLQGGSKVNVEIQIRNQHNMEKRSLFYWSRELNKSLGEGDDYRNIPKVITINIINFSFLPNKDFHTCFHLREDEDKTILTDALEMHFVDMVKWRKQREKDIVNSPLHRWLTWLNPKSRPELVEEVEKMDGAIQKAKEKQEVVLRDEETERLYFLRQLAYWDNVNANEYLQEVQEEAKKVQEEAKKAREELIRVRKEGKEGMEKSRKDIARKLKARGRPVNEIAEDTGLSPAVIKKL